MRKTKIELNKKLFLAKETITALNKDQSNEVVAGKAVDLSVIADKCYPSGCMCEPTVPTWGIACGCNDKKDEFIADL